MKFQINDVRHPKTGANHYCGPAALSILTGIDTKEAAALIRLVSNRSAIKSTGGSDMWKSLQKLGFSTTEIRIPKTQREFNVPGTPSARRRYPTGKVTRWIGPVLNAWLSSTKELRGDDAFLVSVGHHWVVVQGNRRCCGITKEVVFNDDSPGVAYMRKYVDAAYRITKHTEVAVERVLPKRAPGVPAEVTARRLAKRLAAEFDVDIDFFERESRENPLPNAVYPPSDLYENDEDDPYFDDHGSDDWADVLGRVKDYVAAIKAKAAAEQQAAALEGVRDFVEHELPELKKVA